MNKVIALVGMPGAGKTEVAKVLQQKGFNYLRFGQIVLDEALKRGSVNEATEREIRRDLREKYGQGAMAILSLLKIDGLLKSGPVVIDDLVSFEEYKILKEKYGEDGVIVVAICASSKIRYRRLSVRRFDPKKDPKALHRPLKPAEAKGRDFDQIERADQGGPIAMADHYIVNEGSLESLDTAIGKLLEALW